MDPPKAQMEGAGLLGEGALSNMTMAPNLSTISDATTVSMHSPDEYERTSYYNGITGDGDHPDLVYHSDFLTTPKSLHGVFNTPLNGVWDIVGPQICDLIKAHKINWSSVNLARFFTHAPLGEEVKGSLGPIVIWISVSPGSSLLLKNGVKGVVVEWCEAVLQSFDSSNC